MSSAIITSKGQITVPKSVRDALGVEAGDRLTFRTRDDGVIEIEPETLDLLSLCGTIQPAVRGVSVENMDAAIRTAGTRR